ncbi:MAG TPA: PLP-dependent aminotransferase family protein [Paenibacillus sp.]|uniref:MocR-like pyridoxine biosynthesis transcription factor PdxR n=1 Tax=Paenibacillus sp. TaxID=58172 RepID=UPI002C4CF660|nr:PLP-dependent aminotransferase family protein [Paenibacillus sp.]HUC91627.1 PLP-dependent aminotransferase family protein [Paenibacillus sp.]
MKLDFFVLTQIKPLFEARMAGRRHKQTALFDSIRELIVTGILGFGDRLPATRRLAEGFRLSRGSVNAVYDMLYGEGFVRSEVGRGTFVVFRQAKLLTGPDEEPAAAIPLSAWGSRLEAPYYGDAIERAGGVSTMPVFDFGIGGQMDTEEAFFPWEAWKRAQYAEIRGGNVGRVAPQEAALSEGYYPLRQAIARHLEKMRGIRAAPEQIAVTNGSMQAIALLTMLLVNPGDPVTVENPGYPGIWRAIRTAGGIPVPSPTDREGVIPDEWSSRLLFVTPSRQFPTGALLPLERRIALLEWASARRAVIVEDDYDSEFRWGGRPFEPLKTMDKEGRVVYIGSFSKTMPADLRIGYAVLPGWLVEPFRKAKFWTEPQSTGLAEQRALARFMAGGEYGRHLRRMQRVCGRRLACLRDRLQARLGECFALYPSEAGLHVYAEWKDSLERYDAFRSACADAGVVWADSARLWLGQPPRPSALFGFAHLDEGRLREAVERMASVWSAMK